VKKPKKPDAAERIANKYTYTTYPELPKARAAIRRAIRAAEKRATKAALEKCVAIAEDYRESSMIAPERKACFVLDDAIAKMRKACREVKP